jgi:hypothetical protein
VQSKDEDVADLVESVSKDARRVGLDRTFAKISLVAQPENRLSLLGGIRSPAISPGQEQREAIDIFNLSGFLL